MRSATRMDPDLEPGRTGDDPVGEVIRQVKPKLRGWLHAGMTPLALAAGVVLIVLAPTAPGKIGGAVFLAASLLLFGTSGLYHRFHWGPLGEAVLRRMDHANIYVFIAATYTPLALILLDGGSRIALLTLIWSAAAIGLLFRLVWLSAPRWLYTVLYVAMGWAAVGWIGSFYAAAGAAVVALIVAGGVLYTLGAVVYGLKRPDPSPRWFGFHEIFHACTIAGFAVHYTAISLVTYAAH
ncbi:MAG TPA: hemolysin III family protein [Microlunatus sp.]|nr:hemolysin III family protein [Microlunatus sp.]